jgi:hypothetical protein
LELETELAEVRKKLDQLDAQNLRVTDNLRRTIEERDKAVEVTAAFQDQVASLQEQLRQMTAERDAARKFADDTLVELGQWQVGHDAVKEELARSKEVADMFEQENILLRDTMQQLRAKQVHDDLSGLLHAIHLAVEQARELI